MITQPVWVSIVIIAVSIGAPLGLYLWVRRFPWWRRGKK